MKAPEYSEVVRAWSGFNPETWDKLEDGIKDKFCECYDKAENAEESQDE